MMSVDKLIGKHTVGVRTVGVDISLNSNTSETVDYISWEYFSKRFASSMYITCRDGTKTPCVVSYDGGFLVIRCLFQRKKVVCLRNLNGCVRDGKRIVMDTEYGKLSFKLDKLTTAIAFCNVMSGFMDGRIKCKKNIMDSFNLSSSGWKVPGMNPLIGFNPNVASLKKTNWKQCQKVHPGGAN